MNVLDCLFKAKATIALKGVSYRCICRFESHRKLESSSNTEIQNTLNEQNVLLANRPLRIEYHFKKKKKKLLISKSDYQSQWHSGLFPFPYDSFFFPHA